MSDNFEEIYEAESFGFEGQTDSFADNATPEVEQYRPGKRSGRGGPTSGVRPESDITRQSQALEQAVPQMRPHVPGLEESADRILRQVQESDTPNEEWARVESAVALSQYTRQPLGKVWDNLEYYAREITGQNRPNYMNLREAVSAEVERAALQEEMAKESMKLWTVDEDDTEAIENIRARIDQLQRRMPRQDPQDDSRSFFGNVAKDTAYTMRQMLSTASPALKRGAQGAALGGLIGGAIGLASPIPGDTLPLIFAGMRRGGGIGARAGFLEGGYRMEAGGIASELLTMEGPDGERIDPDIIKAHSSTVGALATVPEYLGATTLIKGIPGAKRILETAAHATTKNLAASGFLQNRATQFAGRWAAGVAGETSTELVQEGIALAGEERAKALQNLREENDEIVLEELIHQFDRLADRPDAPFEPADREEIKEQMREIFLTTARGTIAIAGLGAGANVFTRSREMREADQLVRSQSEATLEALASALAERESQETGGQQMNEDPATQTPAERQESLDRRENSLQNQLRQLQGRREQVSAEEVVAIDEAISDIESTLEAIELEKRGLEMTAPEEGAAWQMTREQFNASRRMDREIFRYDSPIRETITKAMPAMSQQEVDAAASLLEMRAESAGVSLNEYIQSTFQEEMFVAGETAQNRFDQLASGEWAAAVSIDQDGRALIGLSEKSDFSSFVHEAGHIFRRQLAPEQQQVAEQWAGVQDGQWTTEAEEKFAEAFEEYLREGKAPTPEIKGIFERIAEFMRRFVRDFRNRWQLDENITEVFDSLFTTQPESQRTAEGELQDAVRRMDEARAQVEGTPLAEGLGPYSLGQTATIRKGEESMAEYGLDPDKVYKVREVAIALENRQKEKYGEIGRNDRSQEAADKISEWMLEEVLFEIEHMPADQSAVGWYEEKFQSALDVISSMFPELATDQGARDVMTAFVAVLSDGQTVVANFRAAIKAYRHYRENGTVDASTIFGGTRNKGIRANLERIDGLISQYGAEGMKNYLLEEKTVGELNKIAQEEGVDFNTQYTVDMVLPMSALVFGPKLGAFYANLMGSSGYLTMDRWWSRTFNRYRGNIVDAATAESIQKWREKYGTPQMTDQEVLIDIVPYRKSAADKGFKNTTAKEKQANTMYKKAYEDLLDQPYNASDRRFMVEVTRAAEQKLRERGYQLNIADIQAILWYYEKRLYSELGARKSDDISYEEAARRAVEDPSGGPERSRTEESDGTPSSDVTEGPSGIAIEVTPADGEASGGSTFQPGGGEATFGQPADGVSEHEQAVRLAVAEGKPVPRQVIEEYADREWAQEELARLDREEARRIHLSGLRTIARMYDSPQEFQQYLTENYPDIAQEATGEAWFSRFWEKAIAETGSREDLNRMWLRQMASQEAVRDYLNTMWANRERLQDRDVDPFMWGLAQQEEMSEGMYEAARRVLKANPTKYRRIEAVMLDDSDTLRLMAQNDEIQAVEENAAERAEKIRRTNPYSDHYRIANEVQDLRARAELLSGNISEQKLVERIEKLEKELSKAREEVRTQGEQLKSRREEMRDFVVSARAEAREGAKEIRRLERERRAARRMKEQMRDIGRKITKPVPDSVQHDYRMQIEAIQAGIDPSFRSPETLRRWQARREFAERHPNAYKLFPKKFQDQLYKKSLNEFTLEELQAVYTAVKNLTDQGRAALQEQRSEWRAEMDSEIQAILDKVLNSELIGMEDQPLTGREKKSLVKEGLLANIRPERLADMLDGGADFSGPVWQAFIQRQRHAREREYRNKYQRENRVHSKMEELGITEKRLGEVGYTLENGKVLSRDEMIDIYAKRKNERSYLTMKYGNNLSDAVQADIVAQLTEQEKQFADFVIGEYEENYNRLRNAHIYLENKDPGKEEYYTPLQIQGVEYQSMAEEIEAEREMRGTIKHASVEKGMLTPRIDIPDKYRKPTRLGAYSMWRSTVDKQEHYIESADAVKRMRYVLRNESFRQAVKQKHGQEIIDQLSHYVDRVANPSIYAAHGVWDKIAKFVRSNTALAYLSFNIVTSIKQLPSAMFFLPFSGHHWFSAIGEIMTDWQGTRRWLEEVAPQLRERSLMRSMEELKVRDNQNAKLYGQFQETISKFGMAPIRFFDKIAITAGFRGVYLAQKAAGATERQAIDKAVSVTMRTQPEAHAAEVASIYGDQGLLGLFLQFSNQLNNIYNMTVYDAPAAFRQGQWRQGAATYMAIGMSAAVMWMLATRSIPDLDEPDDWTEMALKQAFAITPVVGSMLSAGMSGFDSEVSIEVAPQITGQVIGRLHQLAFQEDIDMDGEDWEYMAKLIAQGLSTVAGLPYVFGERVWETGQAIAADDYQKALFEFILGGETVSEEKDD